MVKGKHKSWFDLVYLVKKKNTFQIGVIQLPVITLVLGLPTLQQLTFFGCLSSIKIGIRWNNNREKKRFHRDTSVDYRYLKTL